MFFSFDGIDGVGKSTQMRLFCDSLRDHGHQCVDCRDPGTTAVGEVLREILLRNDQKVPIGRRSEMLVYMAARAQLVDEVIRPALAAGKVVVSDRFVLANIVYQGHAGGVDVELVRQVGEIATDGIQPDCVFLLDMPPEEADRRLQRAKDRMESHDDKYRQRLRDGFLAEATRPHSRIHVLDASRSVAAVQSDIWRIAEDLFNRHAQQRVEKVDGDASSQGGEAKTKVG
jgi:dTMP kinase